VLFGPWRRCARSAQSVKTTRANVYAHLVSWAHFAVCAACCMCAPRSARGCGICQTHTRRWPSHRCSNRRCRESSAHAPARQFRMLQLVARSPTQRKVASPGVDVARLSRCKIGRCVPVLSAPSSPRAHRSSPHAAVPSANTAHTLHALCAHSHT
jgi:hypothetical protein